MNNKDFGIIIKKIAQTLKNKYNDYRGIYFYGSRVRGDNGLRSDYDIVIVFERKIKWEFENEVLNVVYDYLVDNDIVIDCRVYQEMEISNPATPFRLNVKKEGTFYGI